MSSALGRMLGSGARALMRPQAVLPCWASRATKMQHVRPMAAFASGSGCFGGSGNGNGGSKGWGSSESSGEGGGHWGRRLGLTSLAASAAQLALFTAAAEAKKKEPPPPPPPATQELTIEQLTNTLWAVAGPVLTNLGFSGMMGLAAGLAVKKVGQMVAVVIGLVFLLIQGLATQGFITVNWSHVQSTINKTLDLNKDGKVDEQDFKYAVSQGLGAVAQGVPSVGGFLAGFAMGLRM